jgi:hypothetical protein
MYLDSLVEFERYAEAVWHDAPEPAAAGYFGDGNSGGNGGIRGSCGICVAYATLVRAGGPDEQRRLARLRAALRYAAGTHVTGSARCVDGKQWGGSWQSALWAGSLGFAAALVEEHLDADLRAACRRVVAAEADRLADIPPASGYRGDSKAEENAWNTNALALAAAWLHDDPRAPAWTAATKRYMANTYTVPDPARDPLASWITTTTLYPSYACENHGFFHPSYQMVSGMSLGDSLAMARAVNPDVADDLRPFAEHNVLPAWQCLSRVLLDSGEWAYPSGLDWSLHGYGQVSYLAWLAAHFDDPTARWAEERLAQHIASRQRLNADGRFTGESVRNGFYREAVMARRTAFAWWHHALARRPDGARTPPGDSVSHLPDVRLVLQRSRYGFASLSYGARIMGMVVPESTSHPANPYVVTPRYPQLIGAGTSGRATAAQLKRLSVTDRGFDAELHLTHGPLGATRVRFVSFGDAVAVIEWPLPLLALTPESVAAFPLGIENHALTGGSRKLEWASGEQHINALSGAALDIPGRWACVADRYGVIAGPSGRLRYEAAAGYNRRGAAEDDLHYVPDDPLAPRYIVLLPSFDAETTRTVAAGIRWEAGDREAALSLTAPASGGHQLRVALPEAAPPPLQAIPVAAATASTHSERYPPDRATDGDPTTYWISRRGDAEPGCGPTPERPEWLEFRFAEPTRVTAIIVAPRPRYGPRDMAILLDGVVVHEGTMTADTLRVPLPEPVRAAACRLLITSSYDPRCPEQPRNVQVAEVLLATAPE